MRGTDRSRLLAVLRTDIAGSTPFQLSVGDDVAIDAFTHHLRAIRIVAEAHGGRMVSSRGDGLFAVFETVSAAARAGQEIQATNERRARWRDMSPFGLRVGIAVGELTESDGEFRGRPMLEAERLQEVAETGQIVCSATAAAMTAGRLRNDLRPLGMRSLKGFEEPLELLEIQWEQTVNPVAALPPTLQREPSTRFVGRSSAYRDLFAQWDDAIAGRPRVVLIEGEAGVGKSRLARELAVAAHGAGAVPLHAPCQRDGERPYGPLTRALDDYLSRLRRQSHLLGPHAADLAPIVPDLGERFPDMVIPLREGVPSKERSNVRRAVLGWLQTATQDDPLVLVIEDLQWVDGQTLSLLDHLARHLTDERLLVVCTLRPLAIEGAAVESQIRELQRLDGVTHTLLGGLDESATVDLIEDLAGHTLHATFERDFAENLWRHTSGNPFYVQAVLGHLVAQGDLRQVEGRWTSTVDPASLASPPEVREAVRGQLAGLSDDDVALLRVAATLGVEFRLTMLQRLGEHLGLTDLGPIDRAVRASLLHEVPGQADTFRFSHEIVRSVFEAEGGREERARIHELAAETLIDLSGPSGAVDDAAVSYHLAQSLDPATRLRAASHATAGGLRASREGAFDQASALYRQAIDLLDDPATGHEPRLRAEALLGAALASHKAGDPAARDLARDAVDAAEQIGDGELMAKAALVRNRGMFTRVGEVNHELVDAFERSLVMMGGAPTALRSVVLASLGAELTYSADRVRQTEALDEAEQIAAGLPDKGEMAKVLALKANAIWRPGTLGERLEISNALEQATGSMQSAGWRFSAASLGFQASMEAGLYARADMLLGRMEHLSSKIQEPMVSWFVSIRRSVREATLGHLEKARESAEVALSLGTEAWLGDESLLYYFGHRWIIGYHLGRLDEMEGPFAVAADTQDRPVLRPALAAILAETGQLDRCRLELEKVGPDTFDLDDQDLLVTAAVTSMASAAVGDERRASLAYETMMPYEHQMVDNASTHFGSAQHYLGLAAGVLGRHEEAVDRLQRAVDVHRAAGVGPLTARSRVELARQQLRNGSADVVESETLALTEIEAQCRSQGFGGAAAAAATAGSLLDRSGGESA